MYLPTVIICRPMFFITAAKKVMFSSSFLCLSVSYFALTKTSERICMKFSEKVGNGPMNKRLNFGGDPDTGTVFRICHYWDICPQKVVSTDCTARRCSARHALAGIVHSNDVVTSPAHEQTAGLISRHW